MSAPAPSPPMVLRPAQARCVPETSEARITKGLRPRGSSLCSCVDSHSVSPESYHVPGTALDVPDKHSNERVAVHAAFREALPVAGRRTGGYGQSARWCELGRSPGQPGGDHRLPGDCAELMVEGEWERRGGGI